MLYPILRNIKRDVGATIAEINILHWTHTKYLNKRKEPIDIIVFIHLKKLNTLKNQYITIKIYS